MKLHWEAVQKLAKAHHCEDPVSDNNSFRRFLEFWWCQKFNRPMKDPLLAQYSIDELTYEYLRYLYLNPELDPKKQMEAKTVQQDEDAWVKEMMSKIKQAEPTAAAPQSAADSVPAAIPDLPDISTKFEE